MAAQEWAGRGGSSGCPLLGVFECEAVEEGTECEVHGGIPSKGDGMGVGGGLSELAHGRVRVMPHERGLPERWEGRGSMLGSLLEAS